MKIDTVRRGCGLKNKMEFIKKITLPQENLNERGWGFSEENSLTLRLICNLLFIYREGNSEEMHY